MTISNPSLTRSVPARDHGPIFEPTSPSPAPAHDAARKTRMPGPRVPTGGSQEAKRLAAAVLEVLAGARSPTDAATALEISVPRYYLMEQRALEGLLKACEPRPMGRVRTPEQELAATRKELARLERDCARQQALVRAVQRTVGLVLPVTPATKDHAKGKRKRRPTARALKAAAALRRQTANASDSEPPTHELGSGSGLPNPAAQAEGPILGRPPGRPDP